MYSLNSLSWMVKYGRKSQQNFRGLMELTEEKVAVRSTAELRRFLPRFLYLTSASTTSEDRAGDGAMTTSGSPSSTSSQRSWTWIRTDWKHLQSSKVTNVLPS